MASLRLVGVFVLLGCVAEASEGELARIRTTVRAACDEFGVLSLLSPPDYHVSFENSHLRVHGEVSVSSTAIHYDLKLHSISRPGAKVPKFPTDRVGYLRTPSGMFKYSERNCSVVHCIDKNATLPEGYVDIAPHSWFTAFRIPLTEFTEPNSRYTHTVSKRGDDFVIVGKATAAHPSVHNFELTFSKTFLPKSLVGYDPKSGQKSYYCNYEWEVVDGRTLLLRSAQYHPEIMVYVPACERIAVKVSERALLTESQFMSSIPVGTEFKKHSEARKFFEQKYLGNGKSQRDLAMDFQLSRTAQELRYARLAEADR